jgi:hypothetical protein
MTKRARAKRLASFFRLPTDPEAVSRDFETIVSASPGYLRFHSSISDHHSWRRLMTGQRFDQRESVGVLRWVAVLVAIVAAFLLIYFEPPPLVH